MKHILFSLFAIFSYFIVLSQIPAGYYDSAANLNGNQLKIALHNIIDNHTVINYSDLYDHFETTDKKSNGKVWDIYSDVPGGTPPYQYSFISTHECGNYNSEGDCFNKEHSWPKSWFGGEVSPMYSDLFMIYPTDGYVNNKRSNYPYGEVSNVSWTSMNGSKLGTCSYPGYSQTVFEPIDDYKGDLARSYFYMAVRYYGEDSGWPGSDMTSGAELLTWGYNLMYDWHTNDPVSQKETDRNNAVYSLQNNRNPFIDHPEWVDSIWNPLSVKKIELNKIKIYPIPSRNQINLMSNNLILKVEIHDKLGQTVFQDKFNSHELLISTEGLKPGIYMISAYTKTKTFTDKIIIQ